MMTLTIRSRWSLHTKWTEFPYGAIQVPTPAVFTNHNVGDMIDIYKLDEFLHVKVLYIKGRYVSGTRINP